MAWDAQGACALNTDEWPHNPGSHIPDSHVVALYWDQPGMVVHCGGCLQVDGPLGTVVARVVDRCEGCNPGHIDLSLEAFQKIANPHDGNVAVSWRSVPCQARRHEFLEYRMHPGSNADWMSVSIRNTPNAVQSVQISSPSAGARDVHRSPDNQWVCYGCGSGPFTLRTTFSDGAVHTDTGVPLVGGQILKGSTPCAASSFKRVTAPAAAPASAPASAPVVTLPSAPVPKASVAEIMPAKSTVPQEDYPVHATEPIASAYKPASDISSTSPRSSTVAGKTKAKSGGERRRIMGILPKFKWMNAENSKNVYEKGILDFELPIPFSDDSDMDPDVRAANLEARGRNRELQFQALSEAANATAKNGGSRVATASSTLAIICVCSFLLPVLLGA